MLVADYAFVASLVFVIGCNLYFGPRIKSDRVAMQWGYDGKPTWYAAKGLALWGMVAFMLAVRLFIWLVSTYAPQHVHGVQVGIFGFSVTVAAAHLYLLRTAAR
ncbi:MAG: hypothetical protein WAL80_06765 [Xanthobacteraceae bacterium]